MRNWPGSKLVRKIQVFLGFTNFYQCFIQGFSKTAGPLTSMFQTSSTTKSLKNLLLTIYITRSNKVYGSDGGNCEDRTIEKSIRFKNLNKATGYLSPKAKQAFTVMPRSWEPQSYDLPISSTLQLRYTFLSN